MRTEKDINMVLSALTQSDLLNLMLWLDVYQINNNFITDCYTDNNHQLL